MVLRCGRGVEEECDSFVTEFLGEANARSRLPYREIDERGQGAAPLAASRFSGSQATLEAMLPVYDTLGVGYSTGRQQDPRIADVILRAIGDSASIVNVGAGSGSYEPGNRRVVSVEPSLTMIRQRPTPSPLVVQARAEHLPFHDDAFDCALAVLTIHHWSPVREGLRELRRVARKAVILSWDQEVWERFWLFDYCPELRAHDRRRAVAISTIAEALGFCNVIPVPIPHNCLDGFQGAFWKRPVAYLDPELRGSMSGFAQSPRQSYEDGLARLAADLTDGTWQREHSALMERDTMDLGYRLVIADRSATSSCLVPQCR